LRAGEHAIDEALRKVQLAPLLQIPREGREDPRHRPILDPILKPAMARLVGGIALRQIVPRGAVRSTHRIPFRTSRGSRHGRPRPVARAAWATTTSISSIVRRSTPSSASWKARTKNVTALQTTDSRQRFTICEMASSQPLWFRRPPRRSIAREEHHGTSTSACKVTQLGRSLHRNIVLI